MTQHILFSGLHLANGGSLNEEEEMDPGTQELLRNKKEKQNHAFSTAEKFARKKQEEKDRKRQEIERITKEKETALASYKDRKKQQHLKLCKRTSRGQPVMRFQMEVLLDKIKKQKEHS